jgi:hypothetical protein
MADEQVIITKFTADLTDFESGVKVYNDKLKEAEGLAKNLDKTEQKLSNTTGSLADKFDAAAESAKEAAEGTEELNTEVKKSSSFFERAGASIKTFASNAKTSIANAGKSLTSFKGLSSGIGSVFSGAGKSASAAFGEIKKSIGGVVQSIPGIGGIATALGPVGIAAAAVGAGLFKVITNFDAGATAVEGLGIGAGVAFDRLSGGIANAAGKVSDFFGDLFEGGTIVGDVFGAISDGVVFFIEKLTPIGAILGALGITAEGLKEDFAFGQFIAEQLDEQADKQLVVNETLAANETVLAKNLAQLRNTNLTAEERLKIADDITRIERENLKIKQDQLRADLAIVQAQADREALPIAKGGLGEESDKVKAQLSGLKVALQDAETESVRLTEKVAVRREGIVAGEEARKEAIRQKAREARKKAEEQEAKNAEQRVQAQAKLDDVLNGLADDRLARTQTDGEKEITATEKKYADLQKVAQEGIQKLREASPPGAEAAIAQQEANILVQIETAKQQELAEVRKKTADELEKEREEGREQLRKTLLDDTELEREAILEKLDADVELAEKSIENLEERNETIRKLTEQAQKDLTAIVTTEEQKRIDAETAAAEQRAALQQANLDLVKSFAEQSLATLVQSAAEGKGLQEEAAKQLLVLLLDTVEKIVLLNAVNAQTGAIALGFSTGNPAAGIIAGIAVTAIIKGLFAAVKASILGNYKGDDFVGGDGSRPMWTGRDGFLRRLDYGERVVTGKTNAKYYDEMQAMEDGNWDRYLDNNYILPAIESLRYNDDERAVKFVQTDMGQRMAASITLPRMFDKNIVESQMAQSKEQRRTNKLLEEMVHNTRARTSNKRYY